MWKIIGNCIGHNLREAKFSKYSDFMCTACASEKLILRPSPLKIQTKPLNSLKEYKVTFVIRYNHYVGRSGIS
jgi:hypothetical protein